MGPFQVMHSNTVKDSFLAGVLVSAPAWAPKLSTVNEFLTTLTLLCGALLGVGRLWLFIKRRRDEARGD